MPIVYHVLIDPPQENRASIRLELAGIPGPSVDLVLPSWVPGSYHILDYAKHVGPVRAVRPSDGSAVPVQRIDKARWRVASGGGGPVEVLYSVYGHSLVTEGLDVTSEHLFLNAALALPYVDGHQGEPYEVVLHLPPTWRVFSELARIGDSPARLRARDYDELVDSPIDCGQPVELGFHADGIPHTVVLCGSGGNYEAHRLEEDLRRMVEAAHRIIGEPPGPHYTFFYHLTDVRDGGLEHTTSNSCVIVRTMFQPPSSYRRFLSLSSHEYFHAYNVKRIRPAALRPFEYTKESYTHLLWWMEGTTDYYGWLVLRRAGLVSPTRSLEELAKLAARYLQLPGRRVQSLEESSWLAWIDYYVSQENSPNRSISYYDKGFLVSWALDLELRTRTENRSSLDDVLRALWRKFGRTDLGVPEDALPAEIQEATGVDVREFFEKYVVGTEEIDFPAIAQRAGLSFAPKPKPRDADDDPEPGWLGVTFEDAGGRVKLTTVRDGTPARRAGLSPGDEVVAVDGVRVSFSEFPKVLARLAPGTPADFVLFRRGWLTHLSVTPGAAPPESYAFAPASSASPLERQIYESWLGEPWTGPKPAPPEKAA
jgi:predicted metalloprotease with PDZ domain